jgi:hypothetical protein
MCNYCVTSLSYHGFNTTINYGQSELAPTNAPTWMASALIGLSFLSLCHFRLVFFLCLFSTLISFNPFFFLQLYFLPTPFPLSPFNLLTYIFKLKVNSSPFTYSPINLKCVTFISTHLPTPHLFIYLHALPPSYLPTL